MDSKEVEFLTLVCKRPRMFYPSASSFRDILAFMCGVQCSSARPHGDFGDFPEFIIESLNKSRAEPWTDSLIESFSHLDMYDACAELERLIIAWSGEQTLESKSSP